MFSCILLGREAGSEILGKIHSSFCYVKTISYSNSCNLYVICIAVHQSKGQEILMCITFLATQGVECIAQVVVLHRKFGCDTRHFGS